MYSAIWAYPWDLLDEGIDTVIGRIADAGIQGISVAAAYHHIRALCPHNPHRAVYHGEGGVVYFRPNPLYFPDNALHPVESELVKERDLFDLIWNAAARRGIKLHAWTVLHHNTRLGTANPDCTIENAFSDRYPFGLCPSNPAVRAYSSGLVRSLADRYPLDVIELESLGYMGIDHSGHHAKAGIELDDLSKFLLSICFCHHCSARMAKEGLETESVRESVRQHLGAVFAGASSRSKTLESVLGPESAAGILAARDESVLSLLEAMAGEVGRERLSVMVSANPTATGAAAGITLPRAAKSCARFVVQAFQREPEKIAGMINSVVSNNSGIPVHAGLQAIEPFVHSAKDIAASIQTATTVGAEGLQFYHYGLMRLQNLDWIAAGLASSRVK